MPVIQILQNARIQHSQSKPEPPKFYCAEVKWCSGDDVINSSPCCSSGGYICSLAVPFPVQILSILLSNDVPGYSNTSDFFVCLVLHYLVSRCLKTCEQQLHTSKLRATFECLLTISGGTVGAKKVPEYLPLPSKWFHAIPYHFHAIPYHFHSFHTISSHSIPFPFIPYHFHSISISCNYSLNLATPSRW